MIRKTILFAALLSAVWFLFLDAPLSHGADEKFIFVNTAIVNEDERISEQIARADALAAGGDWLAAIEIYQKSVDAALLQDPHYMCPARGEADPWVERYELVVDYCRAKLLGMDAATLAAYRGRFESSAQRALAKALHDRKTSLLEAVARRYCFTRSGLEATRLLAELAFERGDLERAWAEYEAVLEARLRWLPKTYGEKNEYASLLARTAEVFSLLGDGRRLDRIAGIVSADGELSARNIMVNGEGVGLKQHINRLRAALKPARKESPDSFATFGGDNTRGRTQATPPGDPVSIEWRRELIHDLASMPVRWFDERMVSYMPLLVAPYAVPCSGNLFIAAGHSVISLNARDGEENFVYDPYPFYNRKQGIKTPASVDACTVSGSVAYAVAFYTVTVTARMSVNAGSLHAIDLRTGKFLWRAFEQPYRENAERICSTVMLRGDNVYVETIKPMVGQDEYFLWCFDANTGKRKWRCPLVFGLERMVKWKNAARVDVIAVSGHTAIIDSLANTVVAVDLRTGRQKWLAKYNVDLPHLNDGPWYSASERNWCYNPPIVDGNHVIVAPRHSSMIYCLDVDSGTVMWKKSVPRLCYIAGLDEGSLFVIEKKVIILDAADGKTLYEGQSDRFMYPLGRPALTADAMYFPTRDGLYKFDRATEKLTEIIEWKRFDMKAGNVVTTQDGFYVINYEEIVSFATSGERHP